MGIKYHQALHAFNIQDLYVSKDDCYNLSYSEVVYTKENTYWFILSILDEQGFYITYFEKNLLRKK